MEKYTIEGGARLYGDVRASAAKNSVLVLLAACVLCQEEVVICNVPLISDLFAMINILRRIGVRVTFEGNDLHINAYYADERDICSSLTTRLRSSVFMLGAVLSRFHRACIARPGGCEIGLRPIDLHLSLLEQMGVEVSEKDGFILCSSKGLQGANVKLDFPSVGATENGILAGVLASGTTVIQNAAREPEIVDLQNFLNSMGAKVRGAGTSTVVVQGVKKLHSTTYTPIGDRIEGGTFLLAAAVCGGEVCLKGVNTQFLYSLLGKLSENACKVQVENDKIIVSRKGRLECNKVISTRPFPGFPTDLQSIALAVNCFGRGSCLLYENLFETRFRPVEQLKKMGANIRVKGRCALVVGKRRLHGQSLLAEDLRGGAALVVAALAAQGRSKIFGVEHIDRGYASFDKKLRALGAKITRH